MHDTLLNGFTGVVLRLDDLRHKMQWESPASAQALGDALLLADQALLEARESVWEMRSASNGPDDLLLRLPAIGRELASGSGAIVRRAPFRAKARACDCRFR